MKKNSISAVINTKNAESTLDECLSSLSFVDEIIVVDMNSSDETAQIARDHGAQVFFHEDIGYADPARNFALSKAKSEWIVVLDADEYLPKSMQQKIPLLIQSDSSVVAYALPRKNLLFNKWMEHTGWWPDRQIRVFRNGKVSWKVGVHQHPDVDGKLVKLPAKEENAIVHNNYLTTHQFITRLDRYTSLQATERLDTESYEELTEKKVFKTFSNEFFRRFFVYKGIEDGTHGMVFSLLQSMYEVMISVKQWELNGFDKSKNTVGSINALQSFQSDLKYWIADYKVQNSSGLSKIVWIIRRKIRI